MSGFFPKITLPTRLSETACTLIDNVITNNIKCNHISGVLIRKISDHQINFCMINEKCTAMNSKRKLVEVEQCNEQTIEKFQNYLIERNMMSNMDSNIRSDPNKNCNILFSELGNAKKLHMPTKMVKFNIRKHKVQPWMNNVLLRKINKKSDKYSKLLKIPKTDASYVTKKAEFNEYVKDVKNDIKIAKRNYYFHVFNMHKNNMKQTWRTITETLNKQVNSREIPTKIIHNDETLTDNEEIADCFNSYFANIAVQLSSSFEESDRIPSFEAYFCDDNVNPDLSFHFTPVTEDLVLTLISNLQNKTSSGMDGISNKLLKRIKHIIVQPLTLIINQCGSGCVLLNTFNIYPIEKFQNYLIERNVMSDMDSNIRSDPNKNCNILFSELGNAKKLHMPTKMVKFNIRKHKVQPWMNNVLLRKINKKSDKYSKLLKIPKTDASYVTKKAEFNEYVKDVKNDIKIAKRNYYFHVFNMHNNNMKQTWRTITETLNKQVNSREIPTKIIHNDETLTDNEEIADCFNSYFANIAVQLSSSFEESDRIPSFEAYFCDDNVNPDLSFHFTPVTEDLVLTLISNLQNKTSSGMDGISNKLLKRIKHIIVQPLTLIINQSLTSGIYPDKFKISKITPLHKKDDRTIVSNYRPISLLPTMSKIIERVMHSQLYAFLNENNLITEQQYGFRSNHSTELATFKLMDTIMYELDNSHIPCAIFLDLSKAFDTLNYKILLRKLKYYGLGNVAYNLIENYLTNRQQFVKLGNVKSKLIPMLIGVPQG